MVIFGIRVLSSRVIVTKSTEFALIDDDTSRDVVEFKGERLPLSTTTTTQSPTTTVTTSSLFTTRRPMSFTLRPTNRTLIRPPQRANQTLQIANKTSTTTRPTNKHPIRIVAENANVNRTSKPIHVQTEVDPELTELRKRITAGIAAQRLLRERLKQAQTSRLQTTNIKKVFMPIRSRTNGVSRRKSSLSPKQLQLKLSGVKTTQTGKNTLIIS